MKIYWDNKTIICKKNTRNDIYELSVLPKKKKKNRKEKNQVYKLFFAAGFNFQLIQSSCSKFALES